MGFSENDDGMEQLKVTTEPLRLNIISEPYVIYSKFGYQPAVNVWSGKRKREYRLLISAKSLSDGLEAIRKSTELGLFTGLEFWLHKSSEERNSLYIVED